MIQKKSKNIKNKISPGRKQYLTLKEQNSDSLLLVRMGDFYEAFGEDAIKLSKILGIALTSRDSGGGQKTELSGIPYHSIDKYLSKLVNAGVKIAIAEQTSDPKKTKGLVSREITRIVTSGTVTDPELLDKYSNNYLLAISKVNQIYGLAYLDISTSEFKVLEIPKEQVISEISKISPKEIIIDDSVKRKEISDFSKNNFRLTKMPKANLLNSKENILKHFKKESLSELDCDTLSAGIISISNTISYVSDNQMGNTSQITSIEVYKVSHFLQLDKKVIQDLDLLDNDDSNRSLFSILNYTSTPMGARNLKSWIIRPLIQVENILNRQNIVEYFINNSEAIILLKNLLSDLPDLERLSNKILAKSVNPHDLISIKNGVGTLPDILKILKNNKIQSNSVIGKIVKIDDLVSLIEQSIMDDPAYMVG